MDNAQSDEDNVSPKNKPKVRPKKRKRQDSGSSTEFNDILPDNALEVEQSLHASAMKNNLDDVSVKKILKKVVTNDHVLALVKLQEEAEESSEEKNFQPKLTRAKVKELRKVSPKSNQAWNLDNLELTPIKHIHVKTRPEVKALIAQELPEDEDDEEYEPTPDDVPSEDETTVESCSDLESQPRTPATPSPRPSPRVLQDGPFKVPLNTTPARRKLVIDEEEATIALRTRSKLSLSATPIEHIESSFVPPDELPMPVVDDLWNQFLEECMNPDTTKHEEDDDDPEYNVAADADAHDEDEEALENSIIKISKKELNDLVTELFSIMPEVTVDDADALAENLAETITDAEQTEISSHWEGKQELMSDDETEKRPQSTEFEKRDSATRFSIGKTEPEDPEYRDTTQSVTERVESIDKMKEKENQKTSTPKMSAVKISIREERYSVAPPGRLSAAEPPVPLRRLLRPDGGRVEVRTDSQCCILAGQVSILQQQLRQHIQLAATNFLQLYVHPQHWSIAPVYKNYLEQFEKLLASNPASVVSVCNLKPAIELINSWENSVSEDTPENKEMVEFIQKETERCRRRYHSNALYIGNFHETFMNVVANSNVFLYPYLLPAMPYRADSMKRFGYRACEDRLIALGLDQFWQYVEDNPRIFKRPRQRLRHRWGLAATTSLVCKHMLPWIVPNVLLSHIQRCRKEKDNPIYKFFTKREVEPFEHKLLPFNPNLTLYEQPEHEMPRIWLRYLSKNSKRFRDALYKRKNSGVAPIGVPISIGIEAPLKNPLPIDFTKEIISHRANVRNRVYFPTLQDKFDVQIENNIVTNVTNSTDQATGEAGEKFIVIGNNLSKANIPANIPGLPNAKVIGNLIPIGNFLQGNVVNNTLLPCNVANAPTNTINNVVPKVLPCGTIQSTNTKMATGNILSTLLTSGNTKNVGTSTQNMGQFTSVATAKTSMPVMNNGAVAITNQPQQLLFRVVQTNVGSCLVPLQIVQTTNTVNTINRPISSSTEINKTVFGNESPIKSLGTKRKSVNHCNCCLLLRKIVKKQTKITDFFKRKSKECECTDRQYPKVTERLKLLIKNYKSRSWSVHRELQSQLEILNKDRNPMEKLEDRCSIEDIAYVTSYQLKLTIRMSLIRNTQVKNKVNKLFSDFDLDSGDPILLADTLFNFDKNLVDLYKEFLGFLTAQQADKAGHFKDYFVMACVSDLLTRIEAEVPEKERRKTIMCLIKSILEDSGATACNICSSLLTTVEGYPQLAQYVFSLFPHRVNEREHIRVSPVETGLMDSKTHQTASKVIPTTVQNAITTPPMVNIHLETEKNGDRKPMTCNETLMFMDYEAEYSSGEENAAGQNGKDTHTEDVIKNERLNAASEPKTDKKEENLTISKAEVQDNEDNSDSSEMSVLVMSEDETVKEEPAEWKREDDKIILEVLKHYVTPEERKKKLISEIVAENNLYMLLSQSLTHRSLSEIKGRVVYLLQVLVKNEI